MCYAHPAARVTGSRPRPAPHTALGRGQDTGSPHVSSMRPCVTPSPDLLAGRGLVPRNPSPRGLRGSLISSTTPLVGWSCVGARPGLYLSGSTGPGLRGLGRSRGVSTQTRRPVRGLHVCHSLTRCSPSLRPHACFPGNLSPCDDTLFPTLCVLREPRPWVRLSP